MIELRGVSKVYESDSIAVDNLSLDVPSGELCILVGPSGCGKTTTLKMINRLIEPTSGEILLDDVNVLGLDLTQLRRRIGYVMQNGGLFPHLRVADNVATVPRLLGWPKAEIAARVEELLELVGLEPRTYLRRYPHELSGGERQRVGVARALGGNPPVLLMDEPFGAVDPISRKRLQEEFKDLQQKLHKTVVFVTHDIEEALLLGDRIAIMRIGGVLEQYDTPSAVLAKPATSFVADFVGVDRDLQRLSVTRLSREEIDACPAVEASTPVATIATIAHAQDATRVVVVDAHGAPAGVIDVSSLAGRRASTAAELAVPIGGSIPLDSSLKHALITMLREDDGLVAVTDGGRYLGLLTSEGLYRLMRRSSAAPAEA